MVANGANSQGELSADLMGELPEVGPWAKEKLDALARYLEFYTTVLKFKSWRTIYLDAYAGGGRALVRAEQRSVIPNRLGLFDDDELLLAEEAQELIDGSPRVAFNIANPFTRYVFVELDPERLTELQALKAEYDSCRTIDIRPTTAAEGIDWVLSRNIRKDTHRGVAFLDPFGADLSWSCVEKLAKTGLFEVVVNFALNMALVRMLPNSGEVPTAWAARLDAYFGGPEWFDEVYDRRQTTLFGAAQLQKRANYELRLLELYRGKLKAAFGLVSTPRLIRNTRGAPLYHLLWAGPHRKGLEGADYILKMGERLKGGRFVTQ